MQENIKIYKENYEHLPARFVKKIEHDIEYILRAGLSDLKKYIFSEAVHAERSEAAAMLIY